MAELKLTKNELRAQQNRLATLQKYLPTLQLKKALLQLQIHEAKIELMQCQSFYEEMHQASQKYAALMTDKISFNLEDSVQIKEYKKNYENIAGVEVPRFESISFEEVEYNLFDTPPWLDSLIVGLRKLVEARIRIKIAQEKKTALEKELRDVSIKVNLFEKILIPRSQRNIKKIKVFLGDQLLAAVSQAKVAKRKIEERKGLSLNKLNNWAAPKPRG